MSKMQEIADSRMLRHQSPVFFVTYTSSADPKNRKPYLPALIQFATSTFAGTVLLGKP